MADTVAEAAVEKTNLDNVSSSSGSENLDSSFSDVSSKFSFIPLNFCHVIIFLPMI